MGGNSIDQRNIYLYLVFRFIFEYLDLGDINLYISLFIYIIMKI